MKSIKFSSLILFAASAVILSGCAVSLAADITPPPDYRPPNTQEAPKTAAVDTVPAVAPNPAAGKAIYLEKCADCHGLTGMGDGVQGSQLPNQPSALAKAEVARNATPQQWFNVVTRGNIEKFMPPFASLNDRQRWDVTAYILTLSMTNDNLALGKEVYEAQCSSCHGSDGRGAAGANAPDWKAPDRLVDVADAQLWQTITSGAQAQGMPAFGDRLSEAERWAAAGYVRLLSFNVESPEALAAAPETQPEIAPTAGEGKINIAGRVTLPDGRQAPGGLKVILQGFADMRPAISLTGEVDADGGYRFDQVEYSPGMVYVALVDFEGVTYNSAMLQAVQLTPGEEADLPVTVYETTTDTADLSAQRVHIFFDFADPEKLQVVQLFQILNHGDKVVAGAKAGEAVLRFQLPADAQNLQFQDGALGERYLKTDDGFADTYPVLPDGNPHQILFAFDVPYTRKASLNLPIPMPVEAVMVAVPANGVKVASAQLKDAGTRSVQQMGTTIRTYTAAGLQSGAVLSMDISGRPRGETTAVLGNTADLLVGGGALLIVLGLAGVFYFRRRSPGSESDAEDGDDDAEAVETLDDVAVMDAILELDDRHQAGKIGAEEYESRRRELKAKLAELMQDDAS